MEENNKHVQPNSKEEGVVWMCIGSMFLCLGAVEMNKVKKTK